MRQPWAGRSRAPSALWMGHFLEIAPHCSSKEGEKGEEGR